MSSRLERFLDVDPSGCRDCGPTARLETLEATLDAATAERERATAAFGALADDTRYDVVALLVGADEELCVCEIAPLLPVSDSAVSHALGRLADAGLVERRKDGRWRYYRATPLARRLFAAAGTEVDDA